MMYVKQDVNLSRGIVDIYPVQGFSGQQVKRPDGLQQTFPYPFFLCFVHRYVYRVFFNEILDHFSVSQQFQFQLQERMCLNCFYQGIMQFLSLYGLGKFIKKGVVVLGQFLVFLPFVIHALLGICQGIGFLLHCLILIIY